MKTLYKYQIETGACAVEMPRGAEVLSVGAQNNGLYVWALVDPLETVAHDVNFVTLGTGWEPTKTEDLKFLGTTLFHGGALVFHTFIVTKDAQS